VSDTRPATSEQPIDDIVGSGGPNIYAEGKMRLGLHGQSLDSTRPGPTLIICHVVASCVGYRCAVCKTPEPLQIDHIVEWADVRKHEFENMIVLCANCHARKKNTSDPRHINRASLQRIKSNLMLLNGRYSDLERRIIEDFQGQLAAQPEVAPSIFIPERLRLLVAYLIRDGMVEYAEYQSGMSTNFPDGTSLRDDNLRLTLTPKGRQFIASLDR
jgi:HNH endonuclease